MAPSEVKAKNLHLVCRYLCTPLSKKQENNRKKLLKKYKIGDFVHIAHINNLFQSKDRWYFTKEKFKITKVIHDRKLVYSLSDTKGDPITGGTFKSVVFKNDFLLCFKRLQYRYFQNKYVRFV